MKPNYLLRLAAAVLTAARALALDIPSDGSDGVFSPTGNLVVDLSLAPTGAWNGNNTAHAGKGVYDASKWAVVFKYASVDIPSSVAVTFINHPPHASVVWLVAGNVTVDATRTALVTLIHLVVVERLESLPNRSQVSVR